MAFQPSVYIVILNWNGYEDTIECLKSIKNLVTHNFRLSIVLVDNASEDGSVEQLNNFIAGNQDYKLISNRANVGFAEGNNVGIKYALKNKADYVLVLNNDTVVDKNLITEFLAAADKFPKAGVMTAKIYFAKGYEFRKEKYKKSDLGKVIWSAGGKIDWNNVYGSNHGVDEVDHGQFDNITQTDFATGACSFFRATALKKIKLYDTNYFLYLEDLELSQRMKKKRWQIIFVPKAICWHKVSQSSSIGSGLNDYFTTRNRMLFGMKYAPIRAKIALFRESFKLIRKGRLWQRIGIRDYYLNILGKGSWR